MKGFVKISLDNPPPIQGEYEITPKFFGVTIAYGDCSSVMDLVGKSINLEILGYFQSDRADCLIVRLPEGVRTAPGYAFPPHLTLSWGEPHAPVCAGKDLLAGAGETFSFSTPIVLRGTVTFVSH